MQDWNLRDVPFKFQLSNWTIAQTSLKLQSRVIKIADDIPPQQQISPPQDALLAGSQGFMLRGLPVVDKLQTLSSCDGYLVYVPAQYRHCYIDLTLSYDDYQKKFSSKTRSTIQRKIKKFTQHCNGQLSWKIYTKPESMREFFQHARAVSKLTYQERLLDAGIPDSEAFLQQMEQQAGQDLVRAYLLFDGERPVSYLYCPVEENILIYAYLGYDPEYMKLSVGTVLQWLALEELFSEKRFKAFDFTEGESEHKLLFATHQRQCANVFLIRKTLWNRVLVHSHQSVDRFSGWLGAKLEQWGVKAKVKRLLRLK